MSSLFLDFVWWRRNVESELRDMVIRFSRDPQGSAFVPGLQRAPIRVVSCLIVLLLEIIR
jgi:hypothetical protein